MKLCRTNIFNSTEQTVELIRKDGSRLFFDQKTGNQLYLNSEQSKYASKIIPDDGSFTEPNKRTRRRLIK